MVRTARRGVGRFLLPQRLAEWAAIVAGFVVARLVGKPGGWGDWLLLVLAGMLVAVPVALAALREYRRDEQAATAAGLATEYRVRLTVTLSDALTPLVDLVGRINLAEVERRAPLQAQLRQGAVDAAAALCGGSRTRATFFVAAGDQLRPEAWAGRAEVPVAWPLSSRERGKLAAELIESHGRRLVNGGERQSRARAGDGYRSLMLAAVFAGATEFGILVADNPDPAAFETTDLDVLATLAQVLGAGLAASPYGAPNGHRRVERR